MGLNNLALALEELTTFLCLRVVSRIRISHMELSDNNKRDIKRGMIACLGAFH